ncbi:MAG: methylenetetrahydrofolate--tRNA-(uracil(54)-C(5))-methyltransferase (FADH(2)-oxidizing) TrmFO, partial [Candidatus Adiutrix sp.]
MKPIEIIGGGLAGCEAAFRIAGRGYPVRLWEMKPHKYSPAHKLDGLAELVCSNSLRAAGPHSAVGLLKEEITLLGSVVMKAAQKTAVAAGGALAVDRELFSLEVTAMIEKHPLIELVRQEVTAWPDGDSPIVVAGGPLSSAPLAEMMSQLAGTAHMHFYDALAPIVTYDSLDLNQLYLANRYQRGADPLAQLGDNMGEQLQEANHQNSEVGDYLNCPLSQDEFTIFWEALLKADETEARNFEDARFFEACLPIEVMARRGARTLTFGPMKPVGLDDPKTGRRPYAVLQLRR